MERCEISKKKYFRCFEVSTCPPGHVQITTFQVRTCPNHDFWSKFGCFGFKIRFLTEFHNDSASFWLEKLKNQVILIKNFNIWPKNSKMTQQFKKYPKNPRKIWFSYGFILSFNCLQERPGHGNRLWASIFLVFPSYRLWTSRTVCRFASGFTHMYSQNRRISSLCESDRT